MRESELPLHAATISRNKRRDHFYKFVEKNGMDFEKNKLIAIYSVQTGIATRTVERYLLEYITAGTLVQHGTYVVTVMQDRQLTKDEFIRLKKLSESRSDY